MNRNEKCHRHILQYYIFIKNKPFFFFFLYGFIEEKAN